MSYTKALEIFNTQGAEALEEFLAGKCHVSSLRQIVRDYQNHRNYRNGHNYDFEFVLAKVVFGDFCPPHRAA